MKKVFIKPLNRLIEIAERLIEISIDNPLIFRELTFNMYDNLIVSVDNVEIDLSKYGHIIYNQYDLSLTDKKVVNALYSMISKNISNCYANEILSIENKFINILDDVFYNIPIPFQYENEIDISKLLACFGVKYPTVEKGKYIEQLSLYLKIFSEVCHIKCFVSINLVNMLTSEEIILLKDTLKVLDVVLIDCYINNNDNHQNTLIIDSDWCSI